MKYLATLLLFVISAHADSEAPTDVIEVLKPPMVMSTEYSKDGRDKKHIGIFRLMDTPDVVPTDILHVN